MKTFIFVFLLVIISSFQSYSQLLIGPAAGFTLSKIADTRPVQHNVLQTDRWTIGLYAGIEAKYSLNRFFDLRTGLTYAEKGMVRKAEHLSCNIKGSARSKFRYLEIPLLLSHELDFDLLLFRIELGPGFSYWLGGYQKGKIEVNNKAFEFAQEFELVDEFTEVNNAIVQIKKEDINRFDISLNAGIEFCIPLKTIELSVKTTYVQGTISYVKRKTIMEPLMHHRSFYTVISIRKRF